MVFLFLVLYPLLPSSFLLTHSRTHQPTHPPTHPTHPPTPTHSLTHATPRHSTPPHPNSLPSSLHSLTPLPHSTPSLHSLLHSLPPSLTPSLPASLPHSLTPSLDPSLPHSLTPSLPHSLTPSLPHSLTPSLTPSPPHSPTPSLPHSLQEVGCTPWRPSGVPWSPPLCRWLLRGRRGTWCIAKGSDVRPGVPPGPLVSAALPVAFARQVWDLVHCQGVGCMPWRPSGVPWSPPLCRWLLRGRRGTWRQK